MKKLCVRCKIEKFEIDFRVTNTGRLQSWCRACESQYAKESKVKVRRKYEAVLPSGSYVCTKCGITKLYTEFQRNPRRHTGVTSNCKLCLRRALNERYAKLHPPILVEKKKCPRCDVVQVPSKFKAANGLCVTCNGLLRFAKSTDLEAKRELIRVSGKNYRNENVEVIRAIEHRRRLKRFSMTSDQYELMVLEQGGKCAICLKPPTNRGLAVDHDHITGKIRGLLCTRCNPGLGFFSDSIELLHKAIAYLERHIAEKPSEVTNGRWLS